jgi:hypothetical protein
MNNHSETHKQRVTYSGQSDRQPCSLYGKFSEYGYGIDNCNPHVERIIGGLRYSTRTATLIAALDGEHWGAYLFRTAGGRYFHTASHWPKTYDSVELRPVSTDEALTLYSRFQERSWAVLDPLSEAFPEVVVADA